MNTRTKPTLRTVTMRRSPRPFGYEYEPIVSVHRASSEEEAIKEAVKEAYGVNRTFLADEVKRARYTPDGNLIHSGWTFVEDGDTKVWEERLLITVSDATGKKRTARKQGNEAHGAVVKQNAPHPTPAPKSRRQEP